MRYLELNTTLYQLFMLKNIVHYTLLVTIKLTTSNLLNIQYCMMIFKLQRLHYKGMYIEVNNARRVSSPVLVVECFGFLYQVHVFILKYSQEN